MASNFLDSQFIFDNTQAGSEPTGRIPEAPNTSRPLALASSDDESERDDFGGGRSNSFPSLDGLLRQPAGYEAEPGGAANVGVFGTSLSNPRLISTDKAFEQTTALHWVAITMRGGSLSPTCAAQPTSL